MVGWLPLSYLLGSIAWAWEQEVRFPLDARSQWFFVVLWAAIVALAFACVILLVQAIRSVASQRARGRHDVAPRG